MSDSSKPSYDYTQLKALLEEQETFPLAYTHKFIGKNTPEFAAAVEGLERRFGALTLEHARLSAGDGHLAMTYQFRAASAQEVIDLLEATSKLRDVRVIL